LLLLASNLGETSSDIPQQKDAILFASSEAAQRAAQAGRIAPHSTIAVLSPK
jgi:hypothetical protein